MATPAGRPRPAYDPPHGLDRYEVWTTRRERWDCIDTGCDFEELRAGYDAKATERPYWIWDRTEARVVWKSWEAGA